MEERIDLCVVAYVNEFDNTEVPEKATSLDFRWTEIPLHYVLCAKCVGLVHESRIHWEHPIHQYWCTYYDRASQAEKTRFLIDDKVLLPLCPFCSFR